jgi:hypothetical protein
MLLSVAACTNQVGESVFWRECLKGSFGILLNASQYYEVLLKEHAVIALTSPLTSTLFIFEICSSVDMLLLWKELKNRLVDLKI